MGTHLSVRYRGKALAVLSLFAPLLAPFASAQSPAASAAIEEIVVVAQKREQLVQDIGIAVTAFSGRTLRERGIDQPGKRFSTHTQRQFAEQRWRRRPRRDRPRCRAPELQNQ